MAFTTTVGAGGTSLIGTSGVDTTTFAPGTLATSVFIGAQGDNDFITLQVNQANNYTIRGGAGVDTITTTGDAAGFRNSLVTGDDGNDVITISGTIQSATVSGLEGNDTIAVTSINGGFVNGNNGNDIMSSGGAAASTFTNNAKLVGGQGNDAITLGAVAAVSLTSGLVNGQDGDDTITITRVNTMTFGGGSTIFGGQGSDVLNGSANAASLVLSGDLGADNITGGTAGDTIFGGDGNDRIDGGRGNDSMSGGTGVDTFVQPRNAVAPGNVAVSTAGAAIAGVSIAFAGGVDRITDFAAGANGDILSMSGTGGSTFAAAQILTATQAANTVLVAGTVYAVSGNFASGTFTYAANNSGSDTLLMTALAANTFESGDNIGTNANQVVLTGVNVNQLVGANFA